MSDFREIAKSQEVRDWVFFRLKHPFDPGQPKSKKSFPPYLKEGSFFHFKALKPKVRLPDLPEITFDPKLVTIETSLAGTPLDLTPDNCREYLRNPALFSEDEECQAALVRLYPLLTNPGKSKTYGQTELKLIDAWFDRTTENELSLDPYNISEALASLGIFLARSGITQSWTGAKLAEFNRTCIRLAKQIFRTLEFYGDHLTFNHLANNGRGLVWAGYLSGADKILRMGLTIMLKEAERIFQPGGLLREGSPHYHFLLTKNYVEVWLLCKSLSQPADELLPLIRKMIKGCEFLQAGQSVPAIGDLSPDCPRSWLAQVPLALSTMEEKGESLPARGWASHFFVSMRKTASAPPSGCLDDFTRLNSGDYTLIFHCNRKGYVPYPGHAHADTACPVVYFKNHLILMDYGRPDYRPGSGVFCEPAAHNSLIINNRSPEYRQKRVYGQKFLSHLTQGEGPEVHFDAEEITVFLKGYLRFGYQVSRMFRVENETLVLTYRIDGTGSCEVSIPLHLNELHTYRIDWPSGGKILEASQIWDFAKRGCYSDYGVKGRVKSYVWQAKVALPALLQVKIGMLSLRQKKSVNPAKTRLCS